MTVSEILAAGLRNAFVLIGFLCVFLGLVLRQSGETGRGLGMALVVVGFVMIVSASAGRYFGWW